VDIACTGIIRVPYYQIDVPDHRRLIGEITHIGQTIIIYSPCRGKFDAALRPSSDSLDEALHLIEWRRFYRDFSAVGKAQVIKCIEERIFRGYYS